MQKISPIKEKILQYLDLKDITRYKFYQESGITRGVLDKESGISEENIAKFIAYAPEINLNWLLTDKGEMFKTKNEENVTVLKGNKNSNIFSNKRNIEKTLPFKTNIVSESRADYGVTIPLYDGVVIAGQRSIADLSPQTTPIGYINAGDWFKDATGAMQVYDDSMPEYPTGSYVCFREIKDKSLLIYGQDYVIETAEYRVIKKIQRSADQQFLILASTNNEIWEHGELAGRMIHEPFPVRIDDIARIYKVLGSVNRKESIFIYQN